jgi:outer membrane protein TolC
MDEQYLIDKKKPLPLENNLTISLQQAAILAAHRDEEVLAILSELQKAKIDVTDALSHTWPRLGFSSEADIPVGSDSTDKKIDYTGGVYFKYDIWKAVAAADEHAMREAFVNKELERLKIILNGLLKKILYQMAQISFMEFKVKQRNDSLEIAKSAYEIAKLFATQGGSDGSLLQTWKSRIDALTFDLKKSKQELQLLKYSFANLLGTETQNDINVTDLAAVLSLYSSLSDGIPAPSEIWAKHSEARLAEVEYIAAEVNVKLANMESWPRLETSLGIGRVPLSGDVDTTPTLLKLSIDYPLWDMGDNERKVIKAKITRDLVKTRLKNKAESLYNRAKDARFIFQAARENYKDLNASFLEMNNRLQDEKILLAENRLNPLEHTLTQLNVIEADILRQDSLAKIQEAGGNYNFSIGQDVIQDIVPILLDSLLNKQH